MEKRRLVGWGGSGNYLFLSGFSSSRNAPSHQAKNRGHSRSKLRRYQHHCKYAPSRYLPPCDHYHNEYQYYCHDHYCSLLAIFGRRSFALLHLANENVFSCLWRRRCSALSSLQSTELQDFSAAVGTFFRRDERKGNIFPSLTRHLPTLWRAIPTTFFSGMEPLQRSRIFRESFHFTHIRSHPHIIC